MAMRKLKHHEQKLLKKVDFLWQREQNVREIKILRRYHIQDREDYVRYNKIAGHITKLVARLRKLDSADPYRAKMTDQLLDKLYDMGFITTKKSLAVCEHMTVSAMCRRRLPIMMVRMKLSETVREAVTFIEQGHVKVGPTTITDPAFMVTRSFEDYVTWANQSKIKKAVAKYNDKFDDYDLMNA
jgi:U3 small nucleolar ribonucleoprotein protein IMP3